uniref:Alanyl (membrane) aminopeptidase b, tandem duplicate 1 n=2 Tax=Nothobranchius furzeri TaxID=105023 RepID=A0A8C6PQN9_NOTFU
MNRSIRSMGSGFYISKTVGIVGILVGVAALSTIIALSVVYSQEKSRNTQVSPTNGGTTATSTTPTPTPSNKPWDQYRLPKSLVPDHYTVTLWPRLEPDSNTGLYIFTGHSVVKFKCVEDTDLILIHSNKLNFTRQENQQLAMLTSTSGAAPVPSIRTSWLQTVTQYLVLELDAKLVKDQSYQLYTEFTGELADDLGGFYRSEYTENNVTRVVATTQMQPTDARKAFPCFDEPAMKARFNITLIHDHGTVALSNGMEIETINITIGDQHVLQTVFEQTEKMSTYLLAFIVSDFSFINSTIDGVLVRIFARRAAIDANQGDYALNKTGPILKFFEEYYNSTYPLPKSDQIALPDFNAGAMENWGLITYRETALLYGKDFSSNSNQERITTIIGHELAHMWFGNLVTLRWWNDLWLNEGFASYVEYLGADKAEPDWNVKDLIVLNDIHRVFAVDALTSSHPLSSNEEDIQKPAQISELFDAISYSKGASVLRMLSDFLSEDVFKQGLQTYLREFAFETAVYTDLWKHLQQAVTDTHTSLPSKVDEIMNTWVLQMGFPVVTINTTAGTVSQQHFLLDSNAVVTTQSKFNYQWIVPIRWMKTKAPQNIFWLQEKSVSVEDMKVGGADWVLANLHVVGYYRVNYDQNNWERLLGVLSTDHKAIPMINRAQLVDDAFNLARAKIISTVLALRTTKYLKNEREYMPWKSALNNLEFFYLMFDRSEVFGVMQGHLEKAVDDRNVSLPRHVDSIMNPWVLQMGFPVVTIDTTTGKVSQKHFLLDPESNVTEGSPYKYEWVIPVRWMKAGDVQREIWWLMEKAAVNLDMRSGASWLLANTNVTGYYRVNYDLGNWERLFIQLHSDHQVIPVINRAQLVDDAFNLARAQLVSTSLALRSTSYLSQETEFLPWQAALNNLQYYELMLDRTEVHQPMQDYVRKQVTQLFFYFKNLTSNWTSVPEKHTDQYNQVNALRTACRTGLAECRNLTTDWFRLWMNSPQHNPWVHFTVSSDHLEITERERVCYPQHVLVVSLIQLT